MPRCLPNILEGWNEYVEHLPAHTLFKAAGGVFLIAAALTRRVWVHADITMPHIFPNLWFMLVGAPGTGKDMVTNTVTEIFEDVNASCESGLAYYLGEESLSAKGMVDSLASDEARMTMRYLNGSKKEETAFFHSLIGCIPELGTFMPEYNVQLVSIMNDLYNCKRHFRDRIRGGVNKGQRVEIVNPHVAFLFGTQPETLASIFPEQAFKMGFFSRTILVYADRPVRRKLYDSSRSSRKSLWNKIVSDVRTLPHLSGEIAVTGEVQDAINKFHVTECDLTQLAHSRFEDYNTRRSFHLQKLAIVHSVAESPNMIIEMRHWEKAKETLFAFEQEMHKCFQNLVTSKGFHTTIEEITSGREGRIITHRELERILRRRHAAYEIPHIFKSMIASGDLSSQPCEPNGVPTYLISAKGQETLKDD